MYKHRIVQALADFIGCYGGKSRDPFMAAVWYGIKHEVPKLLEALDSSEETITEIEKRLKEVLEVKEPLKLPVAEEAVQPAEAKKVEEEKQKPSRKARKAVAETEQQQSTE